MANRQLIYIPEIEPNTFLLFYFMGETGRSYSLRDYTTDPPTVTYAKAFPYSADDIMLMAKWQFDAEVVPTTNVGYWREHIGKLNQRYLQKPAGME